MSRWMVAKRPPNQRVRRCCCNSKTPATVSGLDFSRRGPNARARRPSLRLALALAATCALPVPVAAARTSRPVSVDAARPVAAEHAELALAPYLRVELVRSRLERRGHAEKRAGAALTASARRPLLPARAA